MSRNREDLEKEIDDIFENMSDEVFFQLLKESGFEVEQKNTSLDKDIDNCQISRRRL